MWQPDLFSGESFSSPEQNMTGSKPNGEEHLEICVPSSRTIAGMPDQTVELNVSCTYMGVTLITRCTLPLSPRFQAERNLIVGACVDALIGDVRDLGR